MKRTIKTSKRTSQDRLFMKVMSKSYLGPTPLVCSSQSLSSDGRFQGQGEPLGKKISMESDSGSLQI